MSKYKLSAFADEYADSLSGQLDAMRSFGFGYIELREKKTCFLPEGETIRGHEFHYFDSTDNGDGFLARKPVTGREYSCMITGENYCIGFPHLYYPSNPEFVKCFVEKMKERYSDKK